MNINFNASVDWLSNKIKQFVASKVEFSLISNVSVSDSFNHFLTIHSILCERESAIWVFAFDKFLVSLS